MVNESDKISATESVNETRKSYYIKLIINTIRMIEENTYEGNIETHLYNIYIGLIVLEDSYSDLHKDFVKAVNIDYKEIYLFIQQTNPSLSVKEIFKRQLLIDKKINNAIKLLPIIKEFIVSYFV